MDKTEERVWVPGYEGLYTIGTDGTIWSEKTRKYLKHSKDKDGYSAVALYSKRKPNRFRVHRLVLIAYEGPPPEGKPLGLHRDGDVSNNRLENLRWGSNSDNMRDRTLHGTCVNSNVTHCPRGHGYSPGNTSRHKTSGSRVCLKCRAEDKARQRERGLPQGDTRHGTTNGWFNWKCRCGPCCEAEEGYRIKRREKPNG